MFRIALVCGIVAINVQAAFAQATKAEDPRLTYLEVSALQTLDRLDLTVEQLQTLQRLGKNAASTLPANAKMRITPAFLKTLTELRDALVADDEDKIGDLKEKLEDVLDTDEIDIDDRVPVSDVARRQTSSVIRMLKASQIHVYMDVIDPEDLDPQTILFDALDDAKDADAAKWKTIRDRATEDVAWLLVGSNELKGKTMAKNLADWLDVKRKEINSGAEDAAYADVEKQMKQVTSALDPFEIMRHAMEHEMAELLSNPRLTTAIGHRLELAKKLAMK